MKLLHKIYKTIIPTTWTPHIGYNLSLSTILVLLGVISAQNYQHVIKLPTEVLVYTQEENSTFAQEYEDELIAGTLEQFEEDFEENMRKAMTKVLIEEQQKLNQAANDIPTYDFSEYQAVLTTLMNTN